MMVHKSCYLLKLPCLGYLESNIRVVAWVGTIVQEHKPSQYVKLDDNTTHVSFSLWKGFLLTPEECDLLVSISNPADRWSLYNNKIRLKEGLKKIQVNSQVELNHGDRGVATVRFKGRVPEMGIGVYFGIEFHSDSKHGSNDGSYMNQRYFNCPPNRGAFVSIGEICLLREVPAKARRWHLPPLEPLSKETYWREKQKSLSDLYRAYPIRAIYQPETEEKPASSTPLLRTFSTPPTSKKPGEILSFTSYEAKPVEKLGGKSIWIYSPKPYQKQGSKNDRPKSPQWILCPPTQFPVRAKSMSELARKESWNDSDYSSLRSNSTESGSWNHSTSTPVEKSGTKPDWNVSRFSYRDSLTEKLPVRLSASVETVEKPYLKSSSGSTSEENFIDKPYLKGPSAFRSVENLSNRTNFTSLSTSPSLGNLTNCTPRGPSAFSFPRRPVGNLFRSHSTTSSPRYPMDKPSWNRSASQTPNGRVADRRSRLHSGSPSLDNWSEGRSWASSTSHSLENLTEDRVWSPSPKHREDRQFWTGSIPSGLGALQDSVFSHTAEDNHKTLEQDFAYSSADNETLESLEYQVKKLKMKVKKLDLNFDILESFIKRHVDAQESKNEETQRDIEKLNQTISTWMQAKDTQNQNLPLKSFKKFQETKIKELEDSIIKLVSELEDVKAKERMLSESQRNRGKKDKRKIRKAEEKIEKLILECSDTSEIQRNRQSQLEEHLQKMEQRWNTLLLQKESDRESEEGQQNQFEQRLKKVEEGLESLLAKGTMDNSSNSQIRSFQDERSQTHDKHNERLERLEKTLERLLSQQENQTAEDGLSESPALKPSQPSDQKQRKLEEYIQTVQQVLKQEDNKTSEELPRLELSQSIQDQIHRDKFFVVCPETHNGLNSMAFKEAMRSCTFLNVYDTPKEDKEEKSDRKALQTKEMVFPQAVMDMGIYEPQNINGFLVWRISPQMRPLFVLLGRMMGLSTHTLYGAGNIFL